MDTGVLIVIVALVVLLVGVGLLVTGRVRGKRRTSALRRHFGPEYDAVVEQLGGRSRGEAELRSRLKLRRAVTVRTLDPEERERFSSAWESAQGTFVETPSTGLRDADLLVMQVMRDRGYPVEHFEERAKLISVDHPELVGRFREAHHVAVANEEDSAGTEELRQAMVDYRYLFDELIDGGSPERTRRI